MLSIFFQTLYTAVDAIWVGRISPEAIAAVSISQITLYMMLSLMIGVTVGSGVMMARGLGRRDRAEAERILGQSFVLNFGAAVVFTVLVLSWRTELLSLIGARGTILPLAVDYFTITGSGSVLIFLFFAAQFGFNAQGDTRTVTILYAISSALNVVLDPALIFGWWIFPELGIRGAAIATLSSQFLLLTLGVTLLAVRPMMIRFRFSNLVARWESVRKVLAIGLPAAFTSIVAPLALAALTAIVAGAFMEPGAVAFAIGFRIEFFAFLPAVGFGTAALALIGQNIGAGDMARARRSSQTATLFALLMGTGIGALAAIFSRSVVGLFTSDPLIAGWARSYLTSVPLTYGVFAAGYVMVSSFQALGRSWRGFAVTIFRLAILMGLGLLVSAATAPNLRHLWWVVIGTNISSAVAGFLWLRHTFARTEGTASGRQANAAVRGRLLPGAPTIPPPEPVPVT
jgi:putative MATE family efflux protein